MNRNIVVAVKIPLAGGVIGCEYQWLPENSMARRIRDAEAERLEAEYRTLASIRESMPACGCLNVLLEAMEQRRKWAQQLRSKVYRQVPICSPRLPVPKEAGRS